QGCSPEDARGRRAATRPRGDGPCRSRDARVGRRYALSRLAPGGVAAHGLGRAAADPARVRLLGAPVAGCCRTSRVALLGLSIPALLGGGGSGDGGWTMFPAPVVMKDPRLDFSRFVTPEHRTTDVQVFYAATRAPAPDGYPERYARTPGDAVRL